MEIINKEADRLCEKHEDFLNSNFKDERKFDKFLSELWLVKEDQLLPQELEFRNDCDKIAVYYNDLRTLAKKLKLELDLDLRRISMPIFVERHPVLRAKWLEIHKDVVDNMIEHTDVNLSEPISNRKQAR